MDQNPLKIEIARSALDLLGTRGIVVDAQVPGLTLSTSQSETAFEQRMKALGWDGPIEIGALGPELGLPYYAVDRRVWETTAEITREVCRIIGLMPTAERE